VGVEKSLLSEAMIQKADILCEKKKLLCDATHYYNENFFLSDELALYILG
jgi:oxygen-independent coproporphyrinogen-3 oxidase